jgi:hypothetical protein
MNCASRIQRQCGEEQEERQGKHQVRCAGDSLFMGGFHF